MLFGETPEYSRRSITKDNYTDQKLTGTAYEVMLNTDIELNKISHHSFGYEELGEAAPGSANVR